MANEVVVKGFAESVEVVDFKNARYFAADLFRECFGGAFPIPTDYLGLRHDPHSGTWHQYVAFYKWSETNLEPVGFCNWIRHDDVYLEGGLCVRPNFYRRLPREQWAECKQLGGVAQLIMEAAAADLDDAEAWFGYCGDKKAYAVDMRVGYRPTVHPFLIVKWFGEVSTARQQELESKIAALGPF